MTTISIHALREEGDKITGCSKSQHGTFLSTPSARRATFLLLRTKPHHLDFYPRPPRGGRRTHSRPLSFVLYFYPRPPRGGRPERSAPAGGSWQISIHALREEGDSARTLPRRWGTNFYPRPPRGGRPPRCGSRPYCPRISIHALREEGDLGDRRGSPGPAQISIHALREEGDSHM